MSLERDLSKTTSNVTLFWKNGMWVESAATGVAYRSLYKGEEGKGQGIREPGDTDMQS